MPIITISRGSYSHGGEVAEKVAERLGYECVSREVLLEVSKEFNIPEIKLQRAIKSAPSSFERYTFGRERYIAYIRAAILGFLVKDNIVYHGFAGHFFVEDIPHVCKVRIIAEMSSRVACMMKREKVSSEVEALRMVNDVDNERRKWSVKLYDMDTWDCRSYDMVLKIEKIGVDDAVNLICDTIGLPAFQTAPESQKKIEKRLEEARAKLEEIAKTGAPFLEPLRGFPWKK